MYDIVLVPDTICMSLEHTKLVEYLYFSLIIVLVK